MKKFSKIILPGGFLLFLLAAGIFMTHLAKAAGPYIMNGGAYDTMEKAVNAALPSDRGTVKGREIAKIHTIAKVQRGDYWVEVVEMNPRENGVEIFVRAWDAQNRPLGFGADWTVETERFVIINPPILVSDPNGSVIRTYTDKATGVTTEEYFREDLQESILFAIEPVIKSKKPGNVVPGKMGRSTLIAYPNAGTGAAPMDGDALTNVAQPGTAFSTLRDQAMVSFAQDGVNAIGYAAARVVGANTSNQFTGINRGGWGWDTSSIGEGTISSATLGFAAKSSATDLGDTDVQIVSLATPANETAMVAGDFDAADLGTTIFDSKTVSTITNDGNNTSNIFTLNANGIAAINKTGNTYFGIRLKWDTANSFTGTWASQVETRTHFGLADIVGTDKDPKLTVEYALPTPVISSLSASNITSTSAVITWTTDISSNSEVNHGTSTPVLSSDPLVTKPDAANVTSHSVTLTGLKSNTIYYYMASSTSEIGFSSTSTQQSFTTLAGSTLFAHKPQDQATSTQANLFIDDDLSIELEADKSYVFTAAITASSTAIQPDINTSFEVPAGASMALTFGSFDGTNKVAGSGLYSSNETEVSIDLPSTGVVVIQVDGTITTGSTAGSVKFEWAQNTSNATEIKVFKGSYLRAEGI